MNNYSPPVILPHRRRALFLVQYLAAIIDINYPNIINTLITLFINPEAFTLRHTIDRMAIIISEHDSRPALYVSAEYLAENIIHHLFNDKKSAYAYMISKNKISFFFVPRKIIDDDLVILALSNDVNMIRQMDPVYLTRKVCLFAIKQQSSLLNVVPAGLMDEEMIIAASNSRRSETKVRTGV